jgi:tRNA modification GTPase
VNVIDLSVDQLIAALASPPGGSARGIVRVSGNQIRDVLSGWFKPQDTDKWSSAKSASSHPGTLDLNGQTRRMEIPVQVLLWPNHRSYTGQPLIELHLPGSPCLLEAVLNEVYRHGARPARPGEFTLRAFLAGKLDLLQAEAVLGVIDAHDQTELETALSQLAGGISTNLSSLRRDLLELLADLEAGLDFIEEDIDFVSRQDVIDRLSQSRQIVGGLRQQSVERMQSRVRSQVVLAGLPNAGKSTLFNRLAGSSSALVSPDRGTTRDFLTTAVSWKGLSFDLIDTAGWEDDARGIAADAQQKRIEQLSRANLVIWCTSAALNESEREIDDDLLMKQRAKSSSIIRLLTKSDLAPLLGTNESTTFPIETVRISAISETGIANLEGVLRRHFGMRDGRSSHWLGMTSARCRETLELLAKSLERCERAAGVPTVGDELIAVDLRDALDHLGVILGVIYTDDILDRVFSKFCIGK